MSMGRWTTDPCPAGALATHYKEKDGDVMIYTLYTAILCCSVKTQALCLKRCSNVSTHGCRTLASIKPVSYAASLRALDKYEASVPDPTHRLE